jgi:hypothetical protein
MSLCLGLAAVCVPLPVTPSALANAINDAVKCPGFAYPFEFGPNNLTDPNPAQLIIVFVTSGDILIYDTAIGGALSDVLRFPDDGHGMANSVILLSDDDPPGIPTLFQNTTFSMIETQRAGSHCTQLVPTRPPSLSASSAQRMRCSSPSQCLSPCLAQASLASVCLAAARLGSPVASEVDAALGG